MEEIKNYTVIIYTENQIGLLAQISNIFTRRSMSIWSLSAGPSSIDGIHNITITTDATERRIREAVRQIIKDAGSFLDDQAIANLEKLGFRYISGKNHHKLEWAGIRFPMSKTPSDHRSCLNSAAEIINRVF